MVVAEAGEKVVVRPTIGTSSMAVAQKAGGRVAVDPCPVPGEEVQIELRAAKQQAQVVMVRRCVGGGR